MVEPNPSVDGAFPQENRTQLVSWLEKLPEMATEQERRLLLEEAGLSDLAQRIDLSGTPWSATRVVVREVLNHGPSSFAAFLTVVRDLAGAEQKESIDRWLQNVGGGRVVEASENLTEERRDRLQALLAELTEEGKQRFWQAYRARSPLWLRHELVRDFADAIERLDDRCKLIPCLACLAANRKLPRKWRDRLMQWCRECDRESFDAELQRWEQKEREKEERPPQVYLLVALHVGRANKSQYRVEAWFQDDSGQVRKIEEGEVRSRDDICDFFKELIARSYERVGGSVSPENFWIEFFLPLESLALDVDCFEVPSQTTPRRIRLGVRYPTVVRSIERLQAVYRKEGDILWQQKWQTFQNGEGKFLPWQRVRRDLFCELADDAVVGLRVEVLPETESEKEDIFSAIVESALPSALWFRHPLEDRDAADKFDRLLDGEYKRLPKRVMKERQRQSARHGKHLALLWENPERVPTRDTALSIPDGL